MMGAVAKDKGRSLVLEISPDVWRYGLQTGGELGSNSETMKACGGGCSHVSKQWPKKQAREAKVECSDPSAMIDW
jgi:hypothetical protein